MPDNKEPTDNNGSNGLQTKIEIVRLQEWQKYVVMEFERLNEWNKKMEKKLDLINERLTLMQVKVAGIASVVGAAASITIIIIKNSIGH